MIRPGSVSASTTPAEEKVSGSCTACHTSSKRDSEYESFRGSWYTGCSSRRMRYTSCMSSWKCEAVGSYTKVVATSDTLPFEDRYRGGPGGRGCEPRAPRGVVREARQPP